MNSKIREIQNKYIVYMEEYMWLDSYADEIWKESQKELLDKIICDLAFINEIDNKLYDKIIDILPNLK